MRSDHSKADKDGRYGNEVRSKVTGWGGSDPTPCGYPAAQALRGSGVATARAFRDFAARSPAFSKSESESDLNWTVKKENRSCHLSQK
jgi:hypothetical protein